MLAEQQLAQAQQVLHEAVSMTQIRAQREQSEHTPKQEQPDLLQVGLDGGWLPSREHKGGMEGKIGVVTRKPRGCGQTRAASARLRATLWRRSLLLRTWVRSRLQPPVTWEQRKRSSGSCSVTEPNGSKPKRTSTSPMRSKCSTGYICGVKCAMQFARSNLVDAPHDAPGVKRSMRCCSPCSGTVNANKHWYTCTACALPRVKCLPLWRRPSGIWRPNATGWAIMSSGRLMVILWGAAWWNVQSPS